jgi:serine/threonine protein kinase
MFHMRSQANILIDDERHVQLCDFGLVVMGDSEAERWTTSQNAPGTKAWMSPQRLTSKRQYRITVADDVYAYACLCYYVSVVVTFYLSYS